MDDTAKKTAGGLAFALALGGCGGGEAEPPTPRVVDPVAVEQSIAESLRRLRGLEIMEVGRLVMQLPAEATACYGPCPDWQSRIQEERARQAPRLAKLADLATRMAPATDLPPRAPAEAPAAAHAITGLQIVEVNAMLLTKPANNPQCYSLPCPADIEAAEQENGRRVAAGFAIAERGRKDGL